MRISLTPEKANSVREACMELLSLNTPSIRQVSSVIGKHASSFPGVMHGPMFYRCLEFDKTQALKYSRGNFERPMNLSDQSKTELHWWTGNINSSWCPITHREPQIVLQSDSSLRGWGAIIKLLTQPLEANGLLMKRKTNI